MAENRGRFAWLALGWLVVATAAGQDGAAMTVETAGLRLRYDGQSWFADARQDGDWLTFATSAADGASRAEAVVDPVLGAGRTLVFATDQRVTRLSIYEGCPFVHLGVRLVNGPAPEVVQSVEFPAMQVLPGRDVGALRSLGTAGLQPVDQQPGSYVFLAIAEPESRAGVVSGWLTCEQASGVFFSGREGGQTVLRPRADFGRLELPPAAESPEEVCLLGWFADARLGLEQYADAVAQSLNIQLPDCPAGYCTWYSRPHGGACDQTHLSELAEFVERELQPYGLDFIQIDDGWQRGKRVLPEDPAARKALGEPDGADEKWYGGPAADFTGHRPDGPYPDGMAPAAANLTGHGLTAGLWLLPFAWNPLGEPLAEHRDWFAEQAPGEVYFTRWAGWCLDTSHPAALDFLGETVRRITQDWGYRYLKLDGLYAGLPCRLTYVNNGYRDDQFGDALRHDPRQTLVSGYRAGLRTVRAAAGDDAFLLGCNVSQNMRSFAASFGLVDAMRIGPDNGPGWDALKRGPWHGSNRWFLHGRIWHNDPDPVYVRGSMPLSHARLIASWVSLTGQLFTASDWLPELPAERLDILRRTLANHGLRPRPVDVFDRDLPRIWHLQSDRGGVRREVMGLFNWDAEKPWSVDEAVEKLGLPAADGYAAFDFWADELLPTMAGDLVCDVPPGSCRILALRPLRPQPQVISTSRHITSGVIDVLSERWDEAARTLTGESVVVAGDDYELRLLTSQAVAEVSADGATAELVSEDGRLARVRLRSATGGNVAWTVRFRR